MLFEPYHEEDIVRRWYGTIFPFIRFFIHSLAVHHGGSPGVASSCYRFTLSFALLLHPIDYVCHHLFLFFPLLLPIRSFSDFRGFPCFLVGWLFPVLVVLVVRVAGAEVTNVTLTGLEVSVTALALEQRDRWGDLGGDVEFVLVPVPTSSRR